MKERAKITISLLIILIFGGIIALGYYQSKSQTPTPQQKEEASKYFEILEPTVNDGDFQNPNASQGGSYENSSIIMIYSLSFKVKAVGGDAHNIVVNGWGQIEPQSFEKILKGQTQYVEETSSRTFPYPSTKVTSGEHAGKFLFSFKISCDEASGKIDVYL